MDYKTYCKAIFLNEENQKEVFERLHKAFPDQNEFAKYSEILNMFPSLNAKSIIASVLIRTRQERERTRVSPEATKEVFDQLIEMLKRNQKIDLASMLKKDRTDHPDEKDSQLFTHFTELVHQFLARIQSADARKLQKKAIKIGPQGGEEEEETIHTKYPNPLYVDDNVEVYQAKTPGACAAFQGDSGICLKYASSFYGTYRIPYQSGFYYIFPKSPRTEFTGGPIGFDPTVNLRGRAGNHRFLLVEVRSDGTGIWSWEDNVMNHFESLDNLKPIFPFLKDALEKNVLKKYPLTDFERDSYEQVENEVNDQMFINFPPQVKDMYISNMHVLTDRQWSALTDVQKNDYINLAMERDISDYQYEDTKKHPQLIKRYLAIKKRGLLNKIKTNQFTQKGLTKHESAVLPNLMSGLDDKSKSDLASSLVKGMKDIITGKVRPTNDISGIYNLFKGQLIADPAMQSDDVFRSIADILGGGKTATWKNLSADIRKSVFDVVEDLYKANPEKLDAMIDDKIASDYGVLLQSLIDVPTARQTKYFENHKAELLSSEEFRNGLSQAIESHLVYGTDMPEWLRGYWKTDKAKYMANPEFMDKIKSDFQNALYGKESEKWPDYVNSPPESREMRDKVMGDIREDPRTMSLVEENLYNLAMFKGADLDNPGEWKASDEFKKYYTDHAKQLAEWLTFKLIDVPPDHKPPALVKTIEKYKGVVLNDPEYRQKIENRLIEDIISKFNVGCGWSSTRIEHWLKNFWAILERYPNSEKNLVEMMKKEYGSDRTANAFYTEYGIPYEFYKKHEKEIMSDPEAFRGMKEKIIEALQWRQNRADPDEVAAQKHLSKIEQDFYHTHLKEFPSDVVSADKRGT